MLTGDVVRPDVEASIDSAHISHFHAGVDRVLNADLFRVCSKIVGNFSSRWSVEFWDGSASRRLVVLLEAITREREHTCVAQCSNVPARGYWIICPLTSDLSSVAQNNMLHLLSSLKPPFHTCVILIRICVGERANQSIEEDINGKGLCGVREPRCGEVGGKVVNIDIEKTGRFRKLPMQNWIWMGTRGVVIGNITMEYVGENEGGGAVANNDGVNIGGKRSDGHAMYVDDARSEIHGSEDAFDMV